MIYLFRHRSDTTKSPNMYKKVRRGDKKGGRRKKGGGRKGE